MISSTPMVHDTLLTHPSRRPSVIRRTTTTATIAPLMTSHLRASCPEGRAWRSALNAHSAISATPNHRIHDGNFSPKEPNEPGPENQAGISPFDVPVGLSCAPLP